MPISCHEQPNHPTDAATKTVRIEFDLVGDDVARFAFLLNAMQSVDPTWTPSQLAASIIAEVLADDAAAHDEITVVTQ